MNTFICGTRKEGKSTLAVFLAKEWSRTVVAYDPKGSIKDITPSLVVHSPDALVDGLESGSYLAENNKDEEDKVIVYRSDSPLAFEEMAQVLFPPHFEGMSGALALIVDESYMLQSANGMNPALKRIVSMAPEYILVIQCAHRFNAYSTQNRAVMNDLYLFRVVGRRNLENVGEECGMEVQQQVENLPIHQCVHVWVDRQAGNQWELWDDPGAWKP